MQIIKMKRVIILLISLFVTFSVNAQTKDFVILGGELSNSAATSVSDIDEVLPRMKALGLNTVLVPVYWGRYFSDVPTSKKFFVFISMFLI